MKLPKIHAHAPCSTSGRTPRHNTRNTPSDARRFCGGTWRSVPDANAHIRRHCNPPSCRLCSPCLGSSYIAPVTGMFRAGAFEKRSLCLQLSHLGCCPVSNKTRSRRRLCPPCVYSRKDKDLCCSHRHYLLQRCNPRIMLPLAKGMRMIAAHMLNSADFSRFVGHPRERRNANRGRTMATFA
jgi:hypothetical protein